MLCVPGSGWGRIIRQEGLVLKDERSPYQLGVRDNSWWKLKPDYLHSHHSVDCLIVGAQYFLRICCVAAE
jgi:ATP-dependent DNA ligase